jgi:glycosyltransferase involved in cell wall biosynthesis
MRSETSSKPEQATDTDDIGTIRDIAGVNVGNIVHIVENMGFGGIETMVLDLVGGTPRSAIFSLSGDDRLATAEWSQFLPAHSTFDAFGKTGRVTPSLVYKITRRLRALRPTGVFLHHDGPLIYGGLAARLAGVRNIIHVEHDAWHYETAPRMRLVLRVLDRVVRPRHIAISETVARGLRTFVPNVDIRVVRIGIDIERFKPLPSETARLALGLDPSCQIVGTVGRLVPVKSQATLIAALPQLSHSVHVVIAGEGPELENLQERAAQSGYGDRIHMVGNCPRPELLYPAFDVFCLPSSHEGLPRTLLEAQACGIPVVASDVGSVSDAVCPRSGQLVAAQNISDMAAALNVALRRPPAPQVPRDFVLGRYTLAHMISSFHEQLDTPP